MVTFQSVKMGLQHYLDEEMLPKFTGWQKWVIGAGMSMYMEKGVEVFNMLKAMPIVQALGVIDEMDNIDLDTIYNHFMKQAQKGAITFKLPLAGDITLTHEDVDKMYSCIMSA